MVIVLSNENMLSNEYQQRHLASKITSKSKYQHICHLKDRELLRNHGKKMHLETFYWQVSQAPAEDLNKRKVARFPYKEGIQRDEPDGCGRPVCALIDTRPMRFSSLCQLVKTMSDEGHYHRILHVQKGDCADASE